MTRTEVAGATTDKTLPLGSSPVDAVIVCAVRMAIDPTVDLGAEATWLEIAARLQPVATGRALTRISRGLVDHPSRVGLGAARILLQATLEADREAAESTPRT